MKISGYSLNQIDAHKGILENKVTVGTRLNLHHAEHSAKGDNHYVLIGFVFEVLYNEGKGHIRVGGSLACSCEKADADKIMKTWNESKKLEKEYHDIIVRFIFSKASIKALLMAEMLALPSPLPLKVNYQALTSKGEEKKKQS